MKRDLDSSWEILEKSEALLEDAITSLEDQLPELVNKLKLETKKNLPKFHLSANLKKIHAFLIDLKCTKLDPQSYPDVDLLDLNQEFQHSQKKKKPIVPPVLVKALSFNSNIRRF